MPRATVVMYYRFIFFRTHEKTKLLHSRKKCGIVNIGPRRISPHSLQVFEDAAFNRKIGNHGIVNPSVICHRIRRVLFPIVIDIHGKTISCCFKLDAQDILLAFARAEFNAGSSIAARMAMIAITISNSISVKYTFLHEKKFRGEVFIFFFSFFWLVCLSMIFRSCLPHDIISHQSF